MPRPVLAALALALLLVSLGGAARAEAQEFVIGNGNHAPNAIAIDEAGRVHVTLDAAWALASIDPATGRSSFYAIETPRAEEQDSLYGISVAPDGTIWTASQAYLHKADPATGNVTSYPFERAGRLVGGVLAGDDAVWVGLVGADAIARFDRESSTFTHVDPPATPFGPLDFARAQDGSIYLTATYANTWARLDPATGDVETGPPDAVQAPTGIALAPGEDALWLGEHGGSNLAHADLETGRVTRYPTTRSPTDYPITGPSGVAVAPDGAVWFVQHFADRVARLDPANRTLVEYELPSGPFTNAQHVALGPGGAAWTAEPSKGRVARVTYGGETPPDWNLGTITLVGGRATAELGEGTFEAASGTPGLDAQVDGQSLVVRSKDAPPGDHVVLVAQKLPGNVTVGRYYTVHVAGEGNDSPGAPAALAAVAVAGAALVLRRRR